MADWWDNYKRKNNLDKDEKKRQETTAAKREVSSTWWDDYKKTNPQFSEKGAADSHAAYLERKRAFTAGQDQLSENHKKDATADHVYKVTDKIFGALGEKEIEAQGRELDRTIRRYERDLPLYQELLMRTAQSPELYNRSYEQYSGSLNDLKEKNNSYNATWKKAEEDRQKKLLQTDAAAYYAETMARSEIEAELARLKAGGSTTHISASGAMHGGAGGKIDEPVTQSGDRIAQYERAITYQDEQQESARIALMVNNVLNRDDYRELAEKGKAAFDDSNQKAFEESNKNEGGILRWLEAAAYANFETSGGTGSSSIPDSSASKEADQRYGYNDVMDKLDAAHLTEDEKDIFYALWAENQADAMAYIDKAKQIANERHWAEVSKKAGENWGSRKLNFVGGTFLNLLGGVSPYSEFGQYVGQTGEAMIGGVGQALKERGLWGTGLLSGEISEDFPILGGKSLADATGLASSMLQSAMNAGAVALSGGSKAVEWLGLTIMGGAAANSDYRKKLAEGWSQEDALGHSLAAGIAEAAFEELSVDKLVNQNLTKGFWKNFFQQAGIEMSEEVCTTLANRLSDAAIAAKSGNLNEVDARARELMAQGMNGAEARKQAEKEWIYDLVNDGLGGFISGGLMTAGNYAIHAPSIIQSNKNMESTGRSAIRAAGTVEALQQYATDNNLGWYGAESSQSAQTENGGAQQIDKMQARQTGSDVERIEAHIQEQISGKSLQEQQEIRDQLQDKYGDGILPSVYQAISIDAAQRADKLSGSDAIREARNKETEQIQDADMRRAVVDGYDQAVFSRAMHGGDADEAGRYFQQLRNTGTGDMTMEATVEGEDGQSKQVAITGMTEDGRGVKLADGSTVAVSKLQADADTMDAVQRIAELEMGADADAVLQAYIKADRQGADGYRWLMDYSLAYEQGRTGKLSLEEAVQRSSLDQRTVMDAYTLGQREAHQSTRDAVESLKAMPKKQGITGKTSNIDTSEIEGVTLNESEREQFELANKLFSLIGVDVKWVASAVKNGRFVGANGSYLNCAVTLDVHAGRNFLEQINSGILATTGHELTHFLQQYAPEQYRALKEFLFRQIVQSSANGETRLERLIWEKQRRASSKLSRKAAEDEVVADACQTMLRDSKAIREFAQQDEETAKGVARWLDMWFGKLKQAFSRSAQLTEEARFVDSFAKEVREAFGKLWDEALREAVRVHDEVGNIENTAQEGGEQLSLREAEKIGYDKLIDQYYNGTLRRANPIYIGSFSSVTGTLFGSTAPLIITGSDLTKSTRPDKGNSRSAHALSESFIRSLPQKINKAQFGYTETRNGVPSFTIVVQDEKSGKLYAVGGALNAQYENRPVNRVLSVFEIDTPEQFLIKEGKALVSKNMNTAKTILEKAGIQSPALQNILDRMRIVSQRGRNVNGKNSDRDIDAMPEKERKNYLFNQQQTETGSKLKTMGGSDIQRSTKYGIGKEIGGRLYVHEQYADQVIPTDVYEQAQQVLAERYPDFEYNCVEWSPKDNVVRFDEAPGFDTEREPAVGDYVTVKPDGTTTNGHTDYIWHHKWQWVANDYSGFDVRQSWEWSKQWLSTINGKTYEVNGKQYNDRGKSDGNGLSRWNAQLKAYGLPLDSRTSEMQYSLRPVSPVQPSSDAWQRGHDEAWFVEKGFPLYRDVSAEQAAANQETGQDKRGGKHGTQIEGTTKTYNKIYDLLQKEHPTDWQDLRILDASSGLGYGTRMGRDRGFNVTDIEPFPSENEYMFDKKTDDKATWEKRSPDYTDYEKLEKMVQSGEIEPFDFIISNAVLNVIPQDTRDNLTVAMGNLLAPGGQMYVNVINKDYAGAMGSKAEIQYAPNGAPMGYVRTAEGDYTINGNTAGRGHETFVWKSNSVQKVFSYPELTAYLQDALGPGYSVEPYKKFGMTAAMVTKDGSDIDRKDVVFAENANVTLDFQSESAAPSDGTLFSERDYDLPSDLELMDRAIEGLSEAGGEEYWKALLETDPGLAEDVKGYKDQARKLAAAEKRLADYKKQMQLGGNRKLNTRGITSLSLEMMKTLDASDAKGRGVAKQVTQTLTSAYQKALDAIDKGTSDADAWDIVYNEGVVPAAEIIAKQGTHSEKTGRGWITTSLESYYGEGGMQAIIDTVAGYVGADFATNRYRKAIQPTIADRIVERTEKRMQKQVDAATERATEAERINKKLTEDRDFWKNQQAKDSETVTFLNERLKEARQDLRDNKSLTAQERRKLAARIKSLQTQLQAKREEILALKSLSQQLDKQAVEFGQKQAKLLDKLEQQVQRERDILSGKLKPLGMQRLLKAEREKAVAKAEQHKDEVFRNYKDRQQQAKLRGRIKNLSDEMKRRMTNPSERAYVPASLYESMTRLADVLDDVLSPNPGSKAEAKYRSMMDAIHGLAREYAAVKDLDDPVYSSEYDQEIQEAISDIERVLERKDADWIAELTGDTKKGLRELSTGELQRIYELMRQINYAMVGATSMLGFTGFKNVFDAMQSVVGQMQNEKSLKSLSKHEKAKRLRMLDNLSVMRAVEMMSGWDRSAALYQLFHAIEQGTDESWAWVMGYNKSLQDLKTGKNEKAYRKALTEALDFGITDEEGLKVTMTKMQAIQILMTAEREAHNDKLLHLQTGGAVIRNAEDIQNGKGAKATSQTVKVTPELLQKIQDSLTDWDRAYIKAVRSYFQKEGRRTNEIMYKLKHRVLQTEEYYVPYSVDKNYLETNLDERQAMSMWVKTPGSTNALQQKAKQPVIIDGMDAVMERHVKEIADYIGLALPIRDFSKVYNGMLKTGGDNPLPVKETIDRAFGSKGQHLLTQAVIDVQGGSAKQNWSSGISDFLSGLQSAFVRSALLINPSVTIKQAASYIAAESILSHRALVAGNRATFSSDKTKSPALIAYLFANPEGKTAHRIYNEIDRYTSLHYQRRLGMSQAEIANEANRTGKLKRKMNMIGANMEQSKIGHAVRKTGENLNPVTWIQRMDVATTATLWVACKEQAKLDGMKAGTAEFWQRTTELYERCLRETQPMYDGLHRTAHQKQAGGLVQFLFPFRTVPIQNHGQLAASYETLKASKNKSKAEQAEAKRFFAKTVWAQTESAFIFSMMTFIAAVLKRKTKKYRDEDEEFTAESFAKGLMTDVGSTLFSVLVPMYGSELVNIGSRALDKFQGNSGYTYDAFSVGVVDMLNDLASSFDKIAADFGKIARGEDVSFGDVGSHGLAMLLKAAKLAGIPADTVRTYFNGIVGNVEDIANGRIPALNDESWERATGVNAKRFYEAWEAGDEAKMQTVLDEVRQSGKSEDSIANAFNSYAKDAYENNGLSLEQYADYLDKTGMFDAEKISGKIKNLVRDEYQAGERSEDATIDVLTDLCGIDGDKAWKTVQEWEAKAEHADEEDYSYSQYEDLREALDEGKSLKEAGADYLAHGYTEKQITDAAVDHLKDRYLAGEISEDEAVKTWAEYKGKDENEAWMAVQRWESAAAHADEEDYSFSQYDAIDEAIAANKDIKALVKELTDHGVEEKNITSHVKSYLVDRYVAGGVTETALKNQLSRYLGIVAKDDVDKILNDANSKKQYGVNYSSLDEEYRAGNIKASEMKNALMKYGGLSAADAEKKIRWYDLQKANPSLEISESKANAWYDGTSYTKTNGHESAKTAGMSIQDYLRAKDELAKVKGVDANNDGRTDTGSREIAYIRTLTAMSWLTDRQRRALYYEEYKGTSKTSGRPW